MMERDHDTVIAFTKLANEGALRSADLALRTGVLINGGAAIAMLAFIGSLVNGGQVKVGELTTLTTSLIWFASGVAAAGAGMGAAYFTNFGLATHSASQELHEGQPHVRPGTATKYWERFTAVFRYGAIITGAAALTFFIGGMIVVRNAIGQLGGP